MVAKSEFHAGEFFHRVGFIVTNLELPSRAVVRFYNKPGTAEQQVFRVSRVTLRTKFTSKLAIKPSQSRSVSV